MLKWTSKSSVHDSSDSVTQTSGDSVNVFLDSVYNKTVEEQGGSSDDFHYSTGHHNDDVLSDDFIMLKNKQHTYIDDSFEREMMVYSEPDLKWTPLSTKSMHKETKQNPSSLSLPSSPVGAKIKSSTKGGILTKFRKIFSKKDQRSKSLPSSPKPARCTVKTRPETPMEEDIGLERKPHTRLERLIESKRKRRKTLSHGKGPNNETFPSKPDWREIMKSQISFPESRHSCYKNEKSDIDGQNPLVPSHHSIEKFPKMKLRSKSSQVLKLASDQKDCERLLPNAPPPLKQILDDERKLEETDESRLQVTESAWNKRYSDNFIAIKKAGDQTVFPDTPPGWFSQHHNVDDMNKDPTYHSEVICSKDDPDPQKIIFRSSRQKVLPVTDPKIIQNMKNSLRPCNERLSSGPYKGKPHTADSRESGNMSMPLSNECRDNNPTKNNNNGQHHIQNQDIDQLTIRTPGDSRWKSSPVASNSDRSNMVSDIPVAVYRESIKQVQRDATPCLKQSSVKDMVRYLEERMVQNSDVASVSPTCAKFGKTQAEHVFTFISPKGSDFNSFPTERQCQSNTSEIFNIISKRDDKTGCFTMLTDAPHNMRKESQTASVTFPLNNGYKKDEPFIVDERMKKHLTGTSNNESQCENDTETFNSQMETSKFDMMFPTSPTKSINACGYGVIGQHNSDVSAQSTLSKMALEARNYCDSSSVSFTSSLNVRLEESARGLSGKSSLSSCSIESISTSSLPSNGTYPLNKQTGEVEHDLPKSIVSLSNFESKSTDEERSTRYVEGVYGDEIDIIDEEIMACVNVTTSEYVNRLENFKTECDKDTKDNLSDNIECVNEFIVERNVEQGFYGFDIDPQKDCLYKDISETARYLHCFQYPREDSINAFHTRIKPEGNTFFNTSHPTDMFSPNDFYPLDEVQNEKVINRNHDEYEPTFLSKALEYDGDVNGDLLAQVDPEDSMSSKRETSSMVEEDQGLIIFTMPEFVDKTQKDDTADISMETNSTVPKRVSFKLEASTMSTASNASSDMAQVEGNLSEQSIIPEEEEEEEQEGKDIEGTTPLVIERSLLDRSVSLDKNTSPSSMGASDISWFLEPTNNGFLCSDNRDPLSFEHLSKGLTADTMLSTDTIEPRPNDTVDLRVCDIEEPSLVMNTYIEESSVHTNMLGKCELESKDEESKLTNISTFDDKATSCGMFVGECANDDSKNVKTNKKEITVTEEITKRANPVIQNQRASEQRFVSDVRVIPFVFKVPEKPDEIFQPFTEGVKVEKQDLTKAKDVIETLDPSTQKEKDLDFVSDNNFGMPSTKDEFLNQVDNKDTDCFDMIYDMAFESAKSDSSTSERGKNKHKAVDISQERCEEMDTLQQHCNQSLSQDGDIDDNSDPTVSICHCDDNNDRYLMSEQRGFDSIKDIRTFDKECSTHEGHSLLSDVSIFDSNSVEIVRVKSKLSKNKKNKISRSLQVSGVERKDAAIFTSSLSMDNSGDCIDSEEEIHSSVHEEIVKAFNASKRSQKVNSRQECLLERYRGRSWRDYKSHKKILSRSRNTPNKAVNLRNMYDVYYDTETSCSLENSVRKSLSAENIRRQSTDLMNDLAFVDDCCDNADERVKMGEVKGSRVENYTERNAKSNIHGTWQIEPMTQDIHWTTALLNYRPGQWLFLATFLFFQLLFHCIYVK